MKFVQTEPQLTTNLIENYFSFHEITDYQGLRYNAIHQPDENRINLVGDITILFLNASDLRLQFTCLAQLENDTYVQLTLMLNTTQDALTTSTSFPHTSVTVPSTIPPTDKDSSEGWKPATIVLGVILLIISLVALCYVVFLVLKDRIHRNITTAHETSQELVSYERKQVKSKEDPIPHQLVAADPSNARQEENPSQRPHVIQTSL